jgi:N-acetylglucosaminyldiphosphoundecaprenol N-acetyl-beta-D-mannosaminyltransferase
MQVAGRRARALYDSDGSTQSADADLGIANLDRNVYCLLGVPIDAIDMDSTLHMIDQASANADPFLVSTANLNYLTSSLSDTEFRESLLQSDLNTADGIPIVWIARLLGLPVKERVAGSDLLDNLNKRTAPRKLKVFFFGAAEGNAEAARRILNAENGGLVCVGALNPGYGTVDDMSGDAIIAAVNASNAEFLVVALGARKAQAWLLQNHDRLRVPVRAHLGAAINFQAGSVKRAPKAIRKAGLEWLWRIKEEPHLRSRYWRDGCTLLRLLWTRILPLAWQARTQLHPEKPLDIGVRPEKHNVVLELSGDATARYINHAICCFQQAVRLDKPLVILDLGAVRNMDQRVFGLILMLRKVLRQRGAALLFIRISCQVRRLFRLNELEFLLDTGPGIHLHPEQNIKRMAATITFSERS